MERTGTEPAVYVGTYAKYNAGSIAGKWLNLEEYADYADFLKACQEVHKDENDPEFMFQDYENFPEQYYGESGIDPELWTWLDMDEDERELLEAYTDNVGEATLEEAQDAYYGKFDSDEEFAQQIAEECGDLDREIRWPYTCIDWEHAAREIMYDFFESSGHYFRNC